MNESEPRHDRLLRMALSFLYARGSDPAAATLAREIWEYLEATYPSRGIAYEVAP